MREESYRDWLTAAGNDPRTVGTRVANLRRIELAYGNLDEAYAVDALESVIGEFAYSSVDKRNVEPNPSKLEIDGDLYSNLAGYRSSLNKYIQFWQSEENTRAAVVLSIAPLVEDTPPEFIEAKLSLEKDLQAALRKSMDQLEIGLTIIDNGKERMVPSGRIDIFARDKLGTPVVIELKAVKAPRDAVAQILAYMGDIQIEAENKVRGILVAPEFDPRAVSAARMVPTLTLCTYAFSFTFSTLEKGSE